MKPNNNKLRLVPKVEKEGVEPPKKKVKTLGNTRATDEELELEYSLFGDILPTKTPLGHAKKNTALTVEREEEDVPAFFIDKGMGAGDEEEEEEEEENVSEKEENDNIEGQGEDKGKKAAWEDEDDHVLKVSVSSNTRLRKLRVTEEEDVLTGKEYTERLRKQFTSTYKNHQKWAAQSSKGDDNLLMWSGKVLDQSAGNLAPGVMSATRMKDANIKEYSEATVQAVQFHPRAQVMLTAGLDKTIRLFQVDGKENAKIQSIHIQNMPILSCQFSADGSQVFAAGRRPFFYVYDMQKGAVEKVHKLQGREEKSLESMYVSPTGKHLVFLGNGGNMLLVDTHTRRLVSTLKMNGTSRAVAFNEDGSRMFTHGGDGQVYVWDMNSRQCIHRFVDEGCLQGTQLALGGKYLATGSDAGVVNIYDVNTCMASEAPKPLKAVMNLTTRIDCLRFNHDTQILAASSHEKKDALKM
eukprot:Ihof_evm1s436 gene=Ihof_evmTU1s436